MYLKRELPYDFEVQNGIHLIGKQNAEYAILIANAKGGEMFQDRVQRWEQIAQWGNKGPSDSDYKNTYIELQEDPTNQYDQNAIAVYAKGECYGKLAYIAKEETEAIRNLSKLSGVPIRDLGCTLVNSTQNSWKVVPLLILAAINNKSNLDKEATITIEATMNKRDVPGFCESLFELQKERARGDAAEHYVSYPKDYDFKPKFVIDGIDLDTYENTGTSMFEYDD